MTAFLVSCPSCKHPYTVDTDTMRAVVTPPTVLDATDALVRKIDAVLHCSCTEHYTCIDCETVAEQGAGWTPEPAA